MRVPARPAAIAARSVRSGLRRVVERQPGARRVATRLRAELDRALAVDGYGGGYFGEDRDPLDRMGLSGYERYGRDTSNADVAAYVVWRFLQPRRSLDVGCATGFVVEALAELDVDAHGCDFSQWAVDHPAAGASGRLQWANLLQRLPYGDASFDVVTVLETLEHLPPDQIPAALASLARVAGRFVVATIPSFGPNEHGPDGFLEAKVIDEQLETYKRMGPFYEGPVPHEDLFTDVRGQPIEGHLTIASFSWWSARFAEVGLIRRPDIELAMHPVLARCGQTEFWNLYVLERSASPQLAGLIPRTEAELREVEARWRLFERPISERAMALLAAGAGPAAVATARLEIPPPARVTDP